jgi:DeoR/GlpR family transcriptional regulator of sugar metabolism
MTSSHWRQEEIIRLARTTGLSSVDELAARFSVSPSTIRRDLAKLQSLGRLARTFGGAMAIRPLPEDPLRQRVQQAFDAKRAIARWAAQQIRPGETVVLDAGSTVAALAHRLRLARDLAVVTTSLGVLRELSGAESIHVECLGGTLRHLSEDLVGPLAEVALERMTFDRAFLGADGITAEDGICEADLQHARLKELMASHAGQTYVLAHAAKLGQRPYHAWARLPRGWTLVTDDCADAASLAPFLACGVNVIVVQAHDDRSRRESRAADAGPSRPRVRRPGHAWPSGPDQPARLGRLRPTPAR